MATTRIDPNAIRNAARELSQFAPIAYSGIEFEEYTIRIVDGYIVTAEFRNGMVQFRRNIVTGEFERWTY